MTAGRPGSGELPGGVPGRAAGSGVRAWGQTGRVWETGYVATTLPLTVV